MPVKWSADEGIRWKIPLPGKGHASPIVHGDRVFIVSCDHATKQRLLLAFAVADGRLLWKREVLTAPLEERHIYNSHASSTPATDGRFVYVVFWETGDKKEGINGSFGPMVVAAYDYDGEQQWLVRPGDFTSIHGLCSCPVIYGDTVIVNGDHDGESFIVALDRKTGSTVWRIARAHKRRSYVTPIIRRLGGREQMILSGSKHVASFDPATGRELWRIEGPTEQFVASLVDDGRYVYLTAGYPDKFIMAIDPTGTGDVTATHVVWQSTRNASYVPSPIIAGDRLLLVNDEGIASCYKAASGERLWNARAGTHFSGSPVSAGGLVYFTDDDGVTTVLRPGDTFDVVSRNELGERCFASPAVSDGRIYFRTEQSLFCIGSPK